MGDAGPKAPDEDYGTLQATGRELREPAATLVELVDDRDHLYTAIRYDEVFRGHLESLRSKSSETWTMGM